MNIISWPKEGFIPNYITEEREEEFIDSIKGLKLTFMDFEVGEIINVTEGYVFAKIDDEKVFKKIMDETRIKLGIDIKILERR